MQEENFRAQAFAQMTLQERSHLHELGEDQSVIADGERFFQHFGQALQFAAAIAQRAILFQELRRVVANLFEPRQQAQHQPATLDAVGAVELL